MEEEESWVREETALALGQVKSPSAASRLERTLNDNAERDYVRAAAARSLGRLKQASSFPIMVGAIATPGAAPELKLALIESLCRYEQQRVEAVQAIAPLADDEDIIVAAAAALRVKKQCATR